MGEDSPTQKKRNGKNATPAPPLKAGFLRTVRLETRAFETSKITLTESEFSIGNARLVYSNGSRKVK